MSRAERQRRSSSATTCWRGLIAAVLVAGQAQAGSAAEWAEPMPLAQSSLLLDADMHRSRIIVVGERGHVLVSSDNGDHWQQTSVPTRSTLTAVQIVDGSRAWAVGHDGLILRSDDGGYTWSLQRRSQEPDRPLLDLWFADSRRGIAVGAYGLLLSTDDGGRTWQDELSRERGAARQRHHRSARWLTVHRRGIRLDPALERPGPELAAAGKPLRRVRSSGSWRSRTRSWSSACAVTCSDPKIEARAGSRWKPAPRATLQTGLVRADGSVVIGGLGGVLLLSDDGGTQLRAPASRGSARHRRPDRARPRSAPGGRRRRPDQDLSARPRRQGHDHRPTPAERTHGCPDRTGGFRLSSSDTRSAEHADGLLQPTSRRSCTSMPASTSACRSRIPTQRPFSSIGRRSAVPTGS